MERIRLSYLLNGSDPGWPGNPTVSAEPYGRIADGAVANEYRVQLFNHFGSHMDGPQHFNDRGPALWQLPVDRFFYDRPLLADIPLSYEELVEVRHLEAYAERLQQADLLLIRSGFSSRRAADPEGYAARGPGISAEACKYLMDHYPQLKAVALDWISLSSYAKQEEGVRAHRYLLGVHHDHAKLILEDLDFSAIEADRLERVVALPLLVQGIDSGPCTVVAELR